jgi:hypothetical protein
MGAMIVALFENHDAAERVRTALVSDGFATDRVELTSRREPGQAGTGPAAALPDQLEDYFRKLFDREHEQSFADSLVQSVRDGRAAITVHPRGEVEVQRAREILQQGSALEMRDRDIDDQTMEQAAAPTDTAPFVKKVLTGKSE